MTPTEYTDRTNLCRGCGRQFVVARLAIDEAKEAYPDEKSTDDEAANIVEVCWSCATGDEVEGEVVLFRHAHRIADALEGEVLNFERGGDAGDEEADFVSVRIDGTVYRARHDAVRYIGDGRQIEWCRCDGDGDLEESVYVGKVDAEAVEAAIHSDRLEG